MKRLIKKSWGSNGEPKEEVEVTKEPEEVVEQHEEPEPEREDPYLGRYVEITNRRSKYYGRHAWVDKKMYSDRYKVYIEPLRYDDLPDDKDYIVNFVGFYQASKWFTVVE